MMLDHSAGEPVFGKLESHTLRGRIAEAIRHAILNGDLPEGSRLVERKLAAQFSTSLTVVREALVQLETEGFVVKRANSSTCVISLTMERVEKIFTVRRVLETFAVEEAAAKATAMQALELERKYHELIEMAGSGRSKEFILKDYAFHEMIWNISGNEYLVAALHRIVPAAFAFAAIRTSKSRTFDLVQDALTHAPILASIKANNPKAARQVFLTALEDWLTSTRAFVFGSADTGTEAAG